MGSPKRIPTNLRTLRILEIFGTSARPMTPTEINEELGLPKQTVHRLCTTLEEEGFLVREKNGRRLQPSPRLKSLASGILYNSRDQIAVRQVLVQIAEKVNETVNLVVPEDDGMMYLERVETDWPFRIQLPVGSHVPFHCTASGKAFLASLSPAARKKFVGAMKLPQLTANTFNDPEKFLEELAAISKQGYAVDNEEFMEGMVAVAVPVHDSKSRYCASIAFHAPTQRLSIEAAIARKDYLLEGAEKLGSIFFD
ncbi:MAG: IclR family transcriptional regulator [Rhizobiaceae bacterium]|nr:IclR family transcriptional regulator [Rhizobiaceae bacterium]